MLKQVYNKNNVLDSATKRISYIFDAFENINVSISGGKDSTVLAYLALKEANRRNIKIGLFFLDEEVVYESTIDQIEYLMNLYPENTIKLWYQIEFNLTNAVSYKEAVLKCWQKGKGKIWMRSKKKDTIHFPDWDREKEKIFNKNIGLDFYSTITNIQNNKPNTAFLVGLRATESMNRWRAVCKNPFKNVYWGTKLDNGSGSFYPIYDWNFHDVWKFIYDEKLKYSKIYDYMYKKGLGMQEIRVSSLIHEKSFKALADLPEFEPKTYDKLLKRISGVQLGNLYGKDAKMLRNRKLPKNYESWMQYKDFLLKTYPDEAKKWIFEKRFAKQLNNNYVAKQQCRQLILNDYENNLPIRNDVDPIEKIKEKWRKLL